MAEDERNKIYLDHRVALAGVKWPAGRLPICSSCKKITNDDGYWGQIEAYIREHSVAK